MLLWLWAAGSIYHFKYVQRRDRIAHLNLIFEYRCVLVSPGGCVSAVFVLTDGQTVF